MEILDWEREIWLASKEPLITVKGQQVTDGDVKMYLKQQKTNPLKKGKQCLFNFNRFAI